MAKQPIGTLMLTLLVTLLLTAGILASPPAVAAQGSVTANQHTLLENVEKELVQQQITIVEQAQTERFTMIYAHTKDDAHVTITLRQTPLEATRIILTVMTDSPADAAFDNRLLQALTTLQ